MTRLAWLTPDDLPSEGLRRWLCIPNTPALLAAVHGALLPLTYEENWELYGTQTPADIALAMSLMVEAFVHQEGQCLPMLYPPILFHDEKTQNTNAGGFTSGAWQLRTLNTLINAIDLAGVSLSNSQFTLPPGLWLIEASCPAHSVGRHQMRLWSVTENQVVAYGSSEIAGASTAQTRSRIAVYQNNSLETTYQIEHRCQTTVATLGMGVASNFGTEVYAQVSAYLCQ